MAYGLALLRCAPMVLSAASVNFSYNQYLFLQPYLDLAKQSETSGEPTGATGDIAFKGIARSQVNVMLAPYIHQQFPSGFAAILALYPTAWVAAGLNLAAGRSAAPALPRASRYFYAAGLVFSIGHMLWGPQAKDLMERLGRLGKYSSRPTTDERDGKSKDDEDSKDNKDNVALLGQWLRLHATRSLVADVPGWLCFTAAFVLSHRFV